MIIRMHAAQMKLIITACGLSDGRTVTVLTLDRLFNLSSAGRSHSGGAAGAGKYPPAQAGAVGGHSGKINVETQNVVGD